MSSKTRVGVLSVLPSPYQRDLFAALAARDDVDLRVRYLEAEAPDSPWPERPLAPYEEVLPGRWVGAGRHRFHLNYRLPDFEDREVVVVNTYTSMLGQWLMRGGLGGTPWVFWGERLREQPSTVRRQIQKVLTAPLHQAAGIVSIGTLALQSYQRLFPDPFHANIPYYTDLDAFSAAGRRAGGDGTVFFCCGQMIHRKGIDVLLAAFDRLVTAGTDAELVLV